MHRDLASAKTSSPSAAGKGRALIAVIGIDHYAAWPRLQNAVNDADGVLRLFRQLGFTEAAPPLYDEAATAAAMRSLVLDGLAHLSQEDSLVLFFAGHGHTQSAYFDDVTVKTGYLIPADAERPGGQVAGWIRLDSWLSDVARLPPRHILVVIDACHGGIALGSLVKWREAAHEEVAPLGSLEELRARRSRRIITSALDDQRALDSGPVSGHSLFTGCLLEGLRGGLAREGRAVATGSELGVYLQQRVSSYPGSQQTPDFGALELDDRGELILPLLGAPLGAPLGPLLGAPLGLLLGAAAPASIAVSPSASATALTPADSFDSLTPAFALEIKTPARARGVASSGSVSATPSEAKGFSLKLRLGRRMFLGLQLGAAGLVLRLGMLAYSSFTSSATMPQALLPDAPRSPLDALQPSSVRTVATLLPQSTRSSPAVIDQLRQRYLRELIEAYEAHLAIDPLAGGEIELRFQLSPLGEVVEPRATGFSSTLDASIVSRMRAWRISPPSGPPSAVPSAMSSAPPNGELVFTVSLHREKRSEDPRK